MLNTLKRKRLGNIEFSLDACTAATYEKIRLKGSFNQTIKNIDNFLEAKNAGSLYVRSIGFIFVIQQHNYREIVPFIDFAYNRGLTASFYLVRGSEELKNTKDELKEILLQGIQRADDLKEYMTKASLLNAYNGLGEYYRQIEKIDILSFLGKKNRKHFLNFISRNPNLKRAIKKATGLS